MKFHKRMRFQERLGIFLNVERAYHDIAIFLKLTDTEVYNRGLLEFAKEKAGDLEEDQLILLSQLSRERTKKSQEETALFERLAFDAHIKSEVLKRQKKEIRVWDGQEVIVGIAE